jgi:HK97 family phage major capsid protein
MDIQEVKGQFEESLKPLKTKLEVLAEDLKAKPGNEEVKASVDKVLVDIGKMRSEHEERLTALEQKASKSNLFTDTQVEQTPGEIVVKSEQWEQFKKHNLKKSEKIEIGQFNLKTAIVNATGQNQPLVPAQRVPGIMEPLRQPLRIRDLIRTVPTSANLIEFVRESSSTNAAAPQGKSSSPQVYENVAKAESAMAFTLDYVPVQTIAHWIPASRQVLDDATALQNYINGRMTYFLKLKEEDQLLNGTGAGGDLDGLITQATAYDTTLDAVGDTNIDTLRHAMLQVELANAGVSAFAFNPTDWHDIELIKTTGTASSGQYIFSNPHAVGQPTIWGRPVVVSQSITAGNFLAADFNIAAEIWDRMSSTVEISREHSDFFVKNMVAILCEERLALVVYRPEAVVYGAFPAAS